MLFLLILCSNINAQISLLNNYQNYNSATIGTFQGISFREAGFSGLYPIPNTNGKEFWVCSDRGVNIDAANANPAACRPTYDKIYGFQNYAPKIHRIRIHGDSIQVLQTITMKRPNGTNATGLLNPTGFGSTAAEQVSTDTVLDCSNFNLKIAPKDIWGIDAEGLVVDKDGNFWICEEGGASIWKLNRNGIVMKRYSPYANLAGAQPQDVLIDTVFKYRKNNRGFEGIAITPNGKIYAMIQSPVLYPTKTVGENTRIHRILEIDPTNDSWKMYAYLNDGIIGTGSNQVRLRDWKIGDMAAINNNEFLVIEAALRGTTDIKKIYKINIAGATPVTSGFYSGVRLEALVDDAGLAANGIVPVTKTLAVDLLANGWPASLEKAEGLAILDEGTIAIVNDNDYGQSSPLENGIATETGITSHLIKYGLGGVNKLSGYDFIGTTLSQGAAAQNSSQTPYLTPNVPGAHFTSILTAGDVAANNYKMVGIPDGLGAFDNHDGTFTVLMNHELGNTSGIVRAHGSKGAFISKWVINKSDLSVESGSDLIQNLKLWNPATSSYVTYNADNPYAAGLNRFCSADLAAESAFYNKATGKGTKEFIFLNGEEAGTEGRAFAHIVSGPEAGTSYELPFLGKLSFENASANPATGDKTVVASQDDATPGQVYFYIGSKTNSGNTIQKAGLSNGNLYGPVISGFAVETDAVIPAAGTPFTMANLGNVSTLAGAALETASNTAGITRFLRPEDGAWDPNNPTDYYFVTTNGFNNPSRLWKLHFNDINNMQNGGTVTVVLNGTEGQKMLDNMTIDNSGHILMQEDVGNNAHLGKIWQYSTGTGELKIVAQHDSTRFKIGGANFLTQDEESSGIIDVQQILGAGKFLAVVQAHYGIAGELVEGGQLLTFFNPDTYNSDPEIYVNGNGNNIVNGDLTPSTANNTQFGNTNLNTVKTKTFVIENIGVGPLIVRKIELTGSDKFSLDIPTLPFTVATNSSVSFNIKFAPVNPGVYNARVNINNNDLDEGLYEFAIQGKGTCAVFETNITMSPNPTVPGQQLNTIYRGYGPQTVSLTASAPAAAAPYTYLWTPGNSSNNPISVSPTSTKNYTVAATNNAGCTTSQSITVNVVDIRDHGNKVFLCHNGNTISVSVSQVPAHLAHGDQLGRCEGSSSTNNFITEAGTGKPAEARAPMIYPNPAGNETIIIMNVLNDAAVSIVLTDMNGRISIPAIKKYLKAGEEKIVLNTSALVNGIYFVKISSGEETTNLKLVVQH